jgi:uncharacterized protein (DUF1501 family)
MSLSRRDLFRAAGLSLVGASASGWWPAFAQAVANDPARRRHCVLLWMTGGPSQIDTFDMKPGHANGGPIKEIETNVPGVRFSEHLPKLAAQAHNLAIVRSLSTKEGDHGRGTFLVRTGQAPGGPFAFPPIGSSLAKALANADDDMPAYVSISPYRAFNQAAFASGFLGPRHAPLTVGAADIFQAQPQANTTGYAELRVDDLRPPEGISQEQVQGRIELWNTLQQGFLKDHASAAPLAQDTVYRRAQRLMNSAAARAFELEEEPASVRDAYGRSRFGQGCLMARRLIERGVSCVEVSLGTFAGGSLGWDTHANNFAAVKSLSEELDAGWASLMRELQERGLLEDTTIIWLGEFGRTPKINGAGGRDHFPGAWTCVFAGGGIQGGQAYVSTTDDGMEVAEHPVEIGDVLATLCKAVGVEPGTQNTSEMGRPIRIAEGKPIDAILAGERGA